MVLPEDASTLVRAYVGLLELRESLLFAGLACLVVVGTASGPWADQGSWVGLLVEIL